MQRPVAPNLILHALACGGRCCAERARGRRIVILDHVLKPWQATSFEPLAGYDGASLRQRHWVHSCPVDDGRLLHVLWQAAESVSMAPALLELLLSHGRLPPSEPVAEYPCPQPDV